jgi:hypothetical protein
MLYVPSIQIRWTMCDRSRTAASSSIAENRKPPSPEIESIISCGRTIVAAIAHGTAIPNVCCPFVMRSCLARKV